MRKEFYKKLPVYNKQGFYLGNLYDPAPNTRHLTLPLYEEDFSFAMDVTGPHVLQFQYVELRKEPQYMPDIRSPLGMHKDIHIGDAYIVNGSMSDTKEEAVVYTLRKMEQQHVEYLKRMREKKSRKGLLHRIVDFLVPPPKRRAS